MNGKNAEEEEEEEQALNLALLPLLTLHCQQFIIIIMMMRMIYKMKRMVREERERGSFPFLPHFHTTLTNFCALIVINFKTIDKRESNELVSSKKLVPSTIFVSIACHPLPKSLEGQKYNNYDIIIIHGILIMMIIIIIIYGIHLKPLETKTEPPPNFAKL